MKTWIPLTTLTAGLLAVGLAAAQAVVGQPAPAFAVADTQGKAVRLADFKGKHVVLEWVNPGCPYVQKHYNSGNMPATQKAARAKDVVWLSINSTAVDHGDYRKPDELVAWLKSKDAAPNATLMDVDGRIGRAYGARTTPHMYLIDPQGKLVYAGAIDSKPTSAVSDIKTATNYVNQALDEALAGKPVSKPTSQAYGCSIKYASAG
jgi:AhpC/TSA family